MRVFTRAFGARPAGCWPAEGAISARHAANCSTAADSAGPRAAPTCCAGSLALDDRRGGAATRWPTTAPTACRGTGMSCFFRDDALSDLIGFTYATWHGDDAAHNLVNEWRSSAREYATLPAITPSLIALDGENAWEHYPFNGYYFLRALYAQLANHPLLELTTLSDCLARGIEPAPLPRVMAGSWVHGTLATWMGDAGKNRAWDLLCDAKLAFDRVMHAGVARCRAAGRGRAAAGAVRELRLVLVVRRLQSRRRRQPVRPALSGASS